MATKTIVKARDQKGINHLKVSRVKIRIQVQDQEAALKVSKATGIQIQPISNRVKIPTDQADKEIKTTIALQVREIKMPIDLQVRETRITTGLVIQTDKFLVK